MSLDLRRLTRCAVLTALALPLTILFPLPGLRLGLANLVTVYALCRLSRREALLILLARCLLGALVGGNLTALAFSLTGGALALGVMAAAVRLGALSLFGVSILGAAHNTGQILAATAVLGSDAPLVYLPPLLLCSLVTGAVTGGASILLVQRVPEMAERNS